MNILHYLLSPLAALFLGLALYLWRREQRYRAVLFLGGALCLFGADLHLALSVAGIVVILYALFKGPEIGHRRGL